MYALKMLRNHGMWQCFEEYTEQFLQSYIMHLQSGGGMHCPHIRQATYRIDAFIRRWVRLGFYGTTDPTAQQLAEEADQCSGKWGTEITMCSITFFQTSSANAIVSGRDHTTTHLQQKLMNVILSLDSCLVICIDLYTDILNCFYCKFYIVISHVLHDWKLKLLNECSIPSTSSLHVLVSSTHVTAH